ncbi:MAG: Zn-ribbon domain-containing OB-fold protein [Planctomycetes bacterium]|nr:Zn-ribbon domain-containing OB-fold protein [Planctomycetota bacterium]
MSDFIRWKGNMPVEYIYTAGLAGERFFREIRDKEKLMGTVCSKCRKLYLPPRLYCESCFKTLDKWKPVPKKGTIQTFTISYTDMNGMALLEPIIVAFITFKGITGGILHKIGEARLEEIKIGMNVVPVYNEPKKRTGSILDIKYFIPT